MEVRETVAFLIFGSSENWLNMRQATRAKKGLIAGILYVVWLSLSSLPLTLGDFIREPARRRSAAAKVVVEKKPAHLVAFGADFTEMQNEPAPTVPPIAALIGGDAR